VAPSAQEFRWLSVSAGAGSTRAGRRRTNSLPLADAALWTPDRPLMHFGQPAHQGQADPQFRPGAVERLVGLDERVEK